MTKHAILFLNQIGGCSLFIGAGEKLVSVNLDLEALCQFTLDQGLTHLWIHPSLDVRFDHESVVRLCAAGYDVVSNWQFMQTDMQVNLPNYLVSLHGYLRYERGRSSRFNLVFLEFASFGWGHLEPEKVLGLIRDLESKLQVAVGGSPAGVGLRYLQKINEKHAGWLAKPALDLSQIPFNQAARPLIWSRRPTEEELSRHYLYKFDKNSAYPRAAVDERFGVGDPVHTDGRGFDHMLPGIWKIDVDFSPELDALLPFPMWGDFSWVATPMVRFLIKIGCGIHVNEAWVFPKHEYIFRNWGKNLWEYSQEHERGTPERAAFKMTMNEPLGLIRSDKFGTDSFKFRPDFYSTIVSATRADVLRKTYKYASQGYYPIMVRVDALYYLSDEKEPNLALPGILDYSSSLGGYKLEWCLEVDDKVRDILLMTGNNRISLLNDLAKKAGY